MIMPVENAANFGNDGGLNQVIIGFQRHLWAVRQAAER
jgi:hypothetical protein